MPITSHDLGFGHGSLIEDSDTGTVQYRATGKFLPAFNVRLKDVTGTSSERRGILKVVMKVHGQGTILAQVEVNHGTTEKVGEWFQARVGAGAVRVTAVAESSLSGELEKLVALHRDGVLSSEELAAAKRKLLGLS